MSPSLCILLLAPNVVGHVRLLTLVAAVLAGGHGWHLPSLSLFLATMLLDGLDGFLARRLQQASTFGAWYDVVLDLACRGILWTWHAPSPLAVLPVLLEALTFAATQAQVKGPEVHWKEAAAAAAPRFVQRVMRNDLRNPLGCGAVLGLFGCPLWLHARNVLPEGHPLAARTWGLVLVPSRLLAAAVECAILFQHGHAMLLRDAAALYAAQRPHNRS